MFGNFRSIRIGGKCNEFLSTTKKLQGLFYEISILKEEDEKDSYKFLSLSQLFLKTLNMDLRLSLVRVQVENSQEILSDIEKVYKYFIEKPIKDFNWETFDTFTKSLEKNISYQDPDIFLILCEMIQFLYVKTLHFVCS